MKLTASYSIDFGVVCGPATSSSIPAKVIGWI
jgi:hypothetical protein